MLLIEFILHRRMVGRMAVIEEGRVVVIHSDDTTGPLHIERRAAQSPRTLELELSSSSRSKGCSPFPNFTTGTWQFYAPRLQTEKSFFILEMEIVQLCSK